MPWWMFFPAPAGFGKRNPCAICFCKTWQRCQSGVETVGGKIGVCVTINFFKLGINASFVQRFTTTNRIKYLTVSIIQRNKAARQKCLMLLLAPIQHFPSSLKLAGMQNLGSSMPVFLGSLQAIFARTNQLLKIKYNYTDANITAFIQTIGTQATVIQSLIFGPSGSVFT